MFSIILVSHGLVGKALVDSLKMIVGGDVEQNVFAYGLHAGDDPNGLKRRIEECVSEQNKKGRKLLILTDLKYGTPFNIATQLMGETPFEIHHICNVNLPLLIESFGMSDSETDMKNLCEDLTKNPMLSHEYVNALIDL